MGNFLSTLFRKFLALLRAPAHPQFSAKLCNEAMNNADVRPNVVYIVASNGYMKWAQLLCPCGCGEIILLNLSSSRRPNWQVRITPNGQVTISPSIWRTEGCKSHFFLRNSIIEWCPHTYEVPAVRTNQTDFRI